MPALYLKTIKDFSRPSNISNKMLDINYIISKFQDLLKQKNTA